MASEKEGKIAQMGNRPVKAAESTVFNSGIDETVYSNGQTRHEDFQSSVRTETMGHYRSLLVSIQAFNGGLSRSILPIRTHRCI
jgi:hypothetical protein